MVQASQAPRASGLLWESGKEDKSRNYIICFMFEEIPSYCGVDSDLERTQKTQEAQLGQAGHVLCSAQGTWPAFVSHQAGLGGSAPGNIECYFEFMFTVGN